MTTSTHPRGTRATSGATRTRGIAGLLAVGALTVGLLAGCSASDSDDSAPAPAAGAAQDRAPADGEMSMADTADASADDSSTTQDRQVVQTGDLSMRADDAAKATQAVVTLVQGAGGRVDDRSEQATTNQSGGSAALTVRIPADKVDATIAAIKKIGTVDSVDMKATDVTGAAQDLDARIHALQISVTRMEDLLAKATTSKDVIDAESALTERQSNLEQLQAERSRLADQVSLSTLTVNIYGPDVAPPVQTEGPHNFFDALAVGWDSLVAVVKGAVIVVGILLPWLLLAGAAAAGVVAVLRWRRTRRPDAPRTAYAGPMPVYAGPAAHAGTGAAPAAPATGPAAPGAAPAAPGVRPDPAEPPRGDAHPHAADEDEPGSPHA